MKIIKLVFSLFILSQSFIVKSYGQQDSVNRSKIDSFIRSKPGFVLKKGIYKNYQEFLDNAPSVNVDFTITQIKKTDADLARGICPVWLNVPGGKIKLGQIWGFCDGNAVYCKFSFLESKYWKLQYVGPYSFFLHVEQIRTPGGLMALQDPVQVFVLNKKGKAKFASEKYLYKLFKSEPSVFTEFDKNPNKGTEYQRQFYLKKFNELVQSKK